MNDRLIMLAICIALGIVAINASSPTIKVMDCVTREKQ